MFCWLFLAETATTAIYTYVRTLSLRDALPISATCHPEGEVARMMVSPIVRVGECALAVGCASELPAPDHERIIEHPALLQIEHKRGGILIGSSADRKSTRLNSSH